MSYLRSVLIYAPLVVISTILYGMVSVVVAYFDPTGDRPMRIARAWGRALCWIAGVEVRVEGLDKVDPNRHYVFSPNHLSYYDTPVILASIPGNFRFMAKADLFDIPFLGTHLRQAGHIPVPLEDPRASIKALAQAAKIINERRISVLIFPEGGRSPDGQLQEFREGAAYTAIKAGIPIVPVALCGTRTVLPMHSMHLRGGLVRVRLGEPIETSELRIQDRAEVTARLKSRVMEMLEAVPMETHA